jgi:hypothetical protein
MILHINGELVLENFVIELFYVIFVITYIITNYYINIMTKLKMENL